MRRNGMQSTRSVGVLWLDIVRAKQLMQDAARISIWKSVLESKTCN